jgi:hypothetical protein
MAKHINKNANGGHTIHYYDPSKNQNAIQEVQHTPSGGYTGQYNTYALERSSGGKIR